MKTYNAQEISQKLNERRAEYRKLLNTEHLSQTERQLIKAKIVAIGEVFDILGLDPTEPTCLGNNLDIKD